MDNNDLRELISLLTEKDISEFAMERVDATIRIKRSRVPGDAEMPAALLSPFSPAGPSISGGPSPFLPITALPPKEDLHILRSQTVGIFRESRVRGGPPLAEAGKMVEEGQITGLIEILRLMSEIEADVTGEIVERMVSEGEPVEYGQALFAIRRCKNHSQAASL